MKYIINTILIVVFGLNANAQSATDTVRYRYPVVPKSNSKNLIPNASFETGRDGWSTQGKPTGWGGDFWSLYGELDNKNAYEGKHSLRIDLGGNKTPVTYYDVWPSQHKLQLSPLTANRGWIDVIPGEQYTLSVYLRGSRKDIPGLLMVFQGPDLAHSIRPIADTHLITLNTGWKRHSFTFTALDKQVFVATGPDLVSNDTATSIWLDGFQLEKGNVPTSFVHYSPVELGIETNKFGNIFSAGDQIAIALTGYNHTNKNENISISLKITDYFDQQIGADTNRIKLRPGLPLTKRWPLTLPGPGYYKLDFTWMQEGVVQKKQFPIAVIEYYKKTDSPFGINHAPTTDNACVALQQAGIMWARNWSVNWQFLEPEENKVSFDLSDVQIAREKKLGFKTLALLPPLPSTNWNSMAPDSIPPAYWFRSAYMPRNRNLLMQFMTKAVYHYRDQLKTWEFLNEPIWTKFCLPGKHYGLPGSDYLPADYTALLREAYTTIKTADPSSTVIGGFSAEPWRYTKEFIASGGLAHLDILNIHNYGTFTAPEGFINEMDSLLSYMDQYGQRKPIWITEYAYYAADQLPWKPWNPPADYSAANLLLANEKQAADWTIRYNVIMLAKGVDKIFYHQGQDGQLNHSVVSLECPILNDFAEPRKLYPAQSALANILGAEFNFSGNVENTVNTTAETKHHVQTYGFQCEKKSVVVGWASEKEKNKIILQIPVDAEVFNIMGTKLQTGNRILLSHSPVYIVSKKSIKDLLASCTIHNAKNTP